MYDCERVMRATIADADFCKETTLRVNTFCNKYGTLSDDSVPILTQKQLNEVPKWLEVLTDIVAFIDNALFNLFGDKAYSEMLWAAIKSVTGK